MFKLSGSQRGVLEAAVYVVPERHLGGATGRKGVLKRPSHPRTISIKLAAHERQLPHQVDFDDFREGPGCRLVILLIRSLLARRSAYVSRCRAFVYSRSSGACSVCCSHGAENFSSMFFGIHLISFYMTMCIILNPLFQCFRDSLP